VTLWLICPSEAACFCIDGGSFAKLKAWVLSSIDRGHGAVGSLDADFGRDAAGDGHHRRSSTC
jgi:hypothetical protein